MVARCLVRWWLGVELAALLWREVRRLLRVGWSLARWLSLGQRLVRAEPGSLPVRELCQKAIRS